MISQLNPEAAVFIPVSLTSLIMMDEAIISASPSIKFEEVPPLTPPLTVEYSSGTKQGDYFMRDNFSTIPNKIKELSTHVGCTVPDITRSSLEHVEHITIDELLRIQSMKQREVTSELEKASVMESILIDVEDESNNVAINNESNINFEERNEKEICEISEMISLIIKQTDSVVDSGIRSDIILPKDESIKGLTSQKKRPKSSRNRYRRRQNKCEPIITESSEGYITEFRRTPPIDLTFKPIQNFSDDNPFGALQTPTNATPNTTPVDEFYNLSDLYKTPPQSPQKEEVPCKLEFVPNTPPSFILRRTPVDDHVVPFEELEPPNELPSFMHPPNANRIIISTELPKSPEIEKNLEVLSTQSPEKIGINSEADKKTDLKGENHEPRIQATNTKKKNSKKNILSSEDKKIKLLPNIDQNSSENFLRPEYTVRPPKKERKPKSRLNNKDVKSDTKSIEHDTFKPKVDKQIVPELNGFKPVSDGSNILSSTTSESIVEAIVEDVKTTGNEVIQKVENPISPEFNDLNPVSNGSNILSSINSVSYLAEIVDDIKITDSEAIQEVEKQTVPEFNDFKPISGGSNLLSSTNSVSTLAEIVEDITITDNEVIQEVEKQIEPEFNDLKPVSGGSNILSSTNSVSTLAEIVEDITKTDNEVIQEVEKQIEPEFNGYRPFSDGSNILSSTTSESIVAAIVEDVKTTGNEVIQKVENPIAPEFNYLKPVSNGSKILSPTNSVSTLAEIVEEIKTADNEAIQEILVEDSSDEMQETSFTIENTGGNKLMDIDVIDIVHTLSIEHNESYNESDNKEEKHVTIDHYDSNIKDETKKMSLEFEAQVSSSQTTPEELKNLVQGFEIINKDELIQENFPPIDGKNPNSFEGSLETECKTDRAIYLNEDGKPITILVTKHINCGLKCGANDKAIDEFEKEEAQRVLDGIISGVDINPQNPPHVDENEQVVENFAEQQDRSVKNDIIPQHQIVAESLKPFEEDINEILEADATEMLLEEGPSSVSTSYHQKNRSNQHELSNQEVSKTAPEAEVDARDTTASDKEPVEQKKTADEVASISSDSQISQPQSLDRGHLDEPSSAPRPKLTVTVTKVVSGVKSATVSATTGKTSAVKSNGTASKSAASGGLLPKTTNNTAAPSKPSTAVSKSTTSNTAPSKSSASSTVPSSKPASPTTPSKPAAPGVANTKSTPSSVASTKSSSSSVTPSKSATSVASPKSSNPSVAASKTLSSTSTNLKTSTSATSKPIVSNASSSKPTTSSSSNAPSKPTVASKPATSSSTSTKPTAATIPVKKPVASAVKPTGSKTATTPSTKPTISSTTTSKPVPKQLSVGETPTLKCPSKPSSPTSSPSSPTTPKSLVIKSTAGTSPLKAGDKSTLPAKSSTASKLIKDKPLEKKSPSTSDSKLPAKKTETPKGSAVATVKPAAATKPVVSAAKAVTTVTKPQTPTPNKTAATKPAASTATKQKPEGASDEKKSTTTTVAKTVAEKVSKELPGAKSTVNGKPTPAKSSILKTETKGTTKTGEKSVLSKKTEEVKKQEKSAQVQELKVSTTNEINQPMIKQVAPV